MGIEIRDARHDDGDALARIDRLTWSPDNSPAPAPGPPFFTERVTPADVLVAEVDRAVAGWLTLRAGLSVPAHGHVRRIEGLAVDPAFGRRGVGKALVRAAVDKAEREGAAKVTLRVLGPNTAARRLYSACGFAVEGVLVGEFRIDGRPVDDVVMSAFPGGRPMPPPRRDRADELDQADAARARLRTLDALAAALRRPGEVASVLSAAADRAAAAAALQELLGVAEEEAHAVLQLQWGRLTRDTLPVIEEDIRGLRDELRSLGEE
ncbi:MAG: hypothetical protein ABS81_19300 [Pseudonocardia sp. SCN 72-86]|nr:MAG: hypothetical protein ABS81_19300 [Pseudonocardia sp. SCN 72-86]